MSLFKDMRKMRKDAKILWDVPPPGAQGTGTPPVTTF
jgi:hypothetical protein